MILASTTYNGIDWVEVDCDDQTTLVVHFLNSTAVAGTLAAEGPVSITGGDSVPAAAFGNLGAGTWSTDEDGRPLLTLHTACAGDFSDYVLSIASPVLDPYYASVSFSFKAECPSTLDCAPAPVTCPAPGGTMPPIDYLAKDFNSFRKALSDYSVWAYPQWVERDEPDVGMVLLELLSAVGDQLSYLQDRFAAEATFATCTERRSLVRHARLVDYEPAPAMSAQVLVQLDVASGPLPPGALLLAAQPDGQVLGFEVGQGLADPSTYQVSTSTFTVDPRWNAIDRSGSAGTGEEGCTGGPGGPWRILPYWWDDSKQCLTAGSTDMWVIGQGYGFPIGDALNDVPGLALLIDTAAASSLDPPLREVVRLSNAVEEVDPLTGTQLTHLFWPASQALTVDHDLCQTHLAGNLLPASEGRRYSEQFMVAPPAGAPPATPVNAIARPGPNASCGDTAPIFLHTLSQGRLAWLPPPGNGLAVGPGPVGGATAAGGTGLPAPVPGAVTALPEIVLTQLAPSPSEPATTWQWFRSLLQCPLYPDLPAYTVDPVSFIDTRPVSQRWSGPAVWEYDGDGGDSVRFGDDVFGQRPDPGTVFQVTYRTTSGAAGNVGADSITGFDPSLGGIVLSATNPFPAVGGADEEPAELVQRRAPYAFQAVQYRAVRAPDYEAAAETLPAVQDAGTSFRWTGSWLTVFTTAEPVGGGHGGDLALADKVDLIELLDRRRLAGYESYVLDPDYVGLDVVVTLCAEDWAFRSDVSTAATAELGTGLNAAGRPGFFAPVNWTFGTALQRSALEAAVQAAVGVEGVVSVYYRRRGVTSGFVVMPGTVSIGADQVVQVWNDPDHPDRGSLSIVVGGGK
jgi:hypothetical protein